jgi:drug/metabolite transporter (DMT)-like permease
LTPVFAAISDKIIYSVSLEAFHVVGIFFMVVCGVCVGISDIIVPKEIIIVNEPGHIEPMEEEFIPTLPVYVAVLCSLAMPLAVTFLQVAQKYATIHLGLSSEDYTFGYFFVMGFCL